MLNLQNKRRGVKSTLADNYSRTSSEVGPGDTLSHEEESRWTFQIPYHTQTAAHITNMLIQNIANDLLDSLILTVCMNVGCSEGVLYVYVDIQK